MHYFNLTQFFVTIVLFYFEALLHFNIGKKGSLGISFPKWKENKLILGVIIVFSFISCLLTKVVEEVLNKLNKSS